MRAMTPRERLEAAIHCAPVDTVPVAPDTWLYWPARFAGRPYWDLDGPLAVEPIWRAHLRVCRAWGLDAIVPAWLGSSPLEPPKTVTVLRDEGTRRLVEVTQPTPAGPAVRRYAVCVDDAAWLTSHPLPTWEDSPKLDAFFFVDPGSRDTTDIREAAAAVGDDGLVMTCVPDPFSQWQGLRGEQAAILDLVDRPAEVRELFARINAQSIASAEASLRAGARVIMTAGSSTSMLSPHLFREFCVPYLRELCAAVHTAGGAVVSHHHGRCRPILEDIVAYGADVIEPLEPPPLGDADLAEAKRLASGKCCIKGNVDTVGVLLQGTPADVERAVRACMEAAKDGYGFILGTADQVARDTPTENFRAFVECGRRYGRY